MPHPSEATRSLVVRVWLPDRPGALGAVASRIGGVGGDVHEIEVVDRGAGRAVDEFLVTVAEAVSDELLAREIAAVDGVDVEDLRPIELEDRDPRLGSLEAAVALAEATPGDLAVTLVTHACLELRAGWAAVVADGTVEATAGPAPDQAWLVAFGGGVAAGPVQEEDGAAARSVSDGDDGEVAWARIGEGARLLVAGRTGVPFRPRERRVLSFLARLAAARS